MAKTTYINSYSQVKITSLKSGNHEKCLFILNLTDKLIFEWLHRRPRGWFSGVWQDLYSGGSEFKVPLILLGWDKYNYVRKYSKNLKKEALSD